MRRCTNSAPALPTLRPPRPGASARIAAGPGVMTARSPERPRKRRNARLGCSLVAALIAALALGGSALRRRWADATAWRQALGRELERRADAARTREIESAGRDALAERLGRPFEDRAAVERRAEAAADAAERDAQWIHEQLAATPEPAAEAILLGAGLVVTLIVVAALVVIAAGVAYLRRKP